jgi:UDP-N-acetyl-D-glucosamine dehydrogenase
LDAVQQNVNVCVVGLGYIGLPLAIQIRPLAGDRFIGLDSDQRKIDLLNSGENYIKHIPTDSMSSELRAGRLSASTDFGQVRNA